MTFKKLAIAFVLVFALCGVVLPKPEYETLGKVQYSEDDYLVLFRPTGKSSDKTQLTIFAVKSLNPDKTRPETASFTKQQLATILGEIKQCVEQSKTLKVGTRGDQYHHDKLYEPGLTFQITSINAEDYGPVCSLFWVRHDEPVGVMFINEKNLPQLLKLLGD
jgi:hypothetical protein